MRVGLTAQPQGDGVTQHLAGRIAVASQGSYVLRYQTRTGALLRIDGAVRGAYDRQHDSVHLPLAAGEHAISLDVEQRALPTSGLPSGPGLAWRLMRAGATERPSRFVEIREDGGPPARDRAPSDGVAVVGHAHLDVAWLWTYGETRRKAARTFATAVTLLENNDGYVFTQSQPQLYAWVQEDEPELFARVQALAEAGRFDASGAAMWVEADCNIPSGESLLRQLFFGMRFAQRELGTMPTVAWLPDSFGFANTLPTLLAHAGVRTFTTTKLCWNDTTTFPHTRFRWAGPDGSAVFAAVLASYEGDVSPQRLVLARARKEPLVVGYGDGGGGPTAAIVDAGSRTGHWTTLAGWFDAAAKDEATLPTVRDELYLEYHRGVFTTHHDIKARNVALERALERAELALSWMTVLRASPFFIDEARRGLAEAWEIVLRNQFHDVLPGTSIAAVYDDVHAEYDRADALVRGVLEAARTSLPRVSETASAALVPPREDDAGFVLENARVRARLRHDGVLVELAVAGGPNLIREANVLWAYEDRPRRWEAWNIDLGYDRRGYRIAPLGSEIADDAVFVRYRIGSSVAAARISLAGDEPFVRVELAVEWRERRTLLRCENRVSLEDARAFFGSPHGVVERSANPRTAAERAKFEACGQRYGRVEGKAASGPGCVCLLVLDTYGWSVGPDTVGGVRLGHSLLRGTTWPDEDADLGEHRIAYAFLPFGAATHGHIEQAWRRFAVSSDGLAEMFSCDDPAMLIVATKPADDGEGIVVRVRECGGVDRDFIVRCAARATSATPVDALERPLAGAATLRDGAIFARCPAFGLRSFRVTFA